MYHLSSFFIRINYIIAGEFNFHIDDTSNYTVKAFLNITESYNQVQYIKGLILIHNCCHTLDIVFPLGLNVNNLSIRELFVSDHMCILLDTVETN